MSKKKKAPKAAAAPKVVVVNPSKPKPKKKNPSKKKATSAKAPIVQVVMPKKNPSHKRKTRKNPSGSLGMNALQIVGGAAAVIAVGYGVDQIQTDPTYQAIGAVVVEGAIGVGAMYAGAELAGASALGAALQQTSDRGRLLYARMQAKKAQAPTTTQQKTGTGAIRRQQLTQGGTVASMADRVSGAAGL